MTEQPSLVPTFLYAPDGMSKIVDMPEGARKNSTPPEGWSFYPPAGVDVREPVNPQAALVAASAASSNDPGLSARVAALEEKMGFVLGLMDQGSQPEPEGEGKASGAPDKGELVARARELGVSEIDGRNIDGRTAVAKLQQAIAEAEAAKKAD